MGDDTHGHVDDIARFTDARTIVLAVEDDPADENHARSVDNLRRLELAARDWPGGLRVVRLPFPRPVTMDGERLPASYANFYIANGIVIVPTFNDRERSRRARTRSPELFPGTGGGGDPRGGSGLGARDAALPHAAAAGGALRPGTEISKDGQAAAVSAQARELGAGGRLLFGIEMPVGHRETVGRAHAGSSGAYGNEPCAALCRRARILWHKAAAQD